MQQEIKDKISLSQKKAHAKKSLKEKMALRSKIAQAMRNKWTERNVHDRQLSQEVKDKISQSLKLYHSNKNKSNQNSEIKQNTEIEVIEAEKGNKIKAIIKINENGDKVYSYYKRRTGRPKKRGPKAQIKNKAQCISVAKKYETFREFRETNPIAYKLALKKGWMTDYIWLVDDRVNICTDKVDTVYAYIFEDYKTVYVGRTLTKRIKDRDYEHIFTDNDPVAKFSKEYKTPIPEIKIIETNLTLAEGLIKEDYYLEYYKNNGYCVLNKARTGLGHGSLGRISGLRNRLDTTNSSKNYVGNRAKNGVPDCPLR